MAVKRDLFSPLEEEILNENDDEQFEAYCRETEEEGCPLFTPEAEDQLRVQWEIDEFMYSFNSKRIFNN